MLSTIVHNIISLYELLEKYIRLLGTYSTFHPHVSLLHVTQCHSTPVFLLFLSFVRFYSTS